MSLSRTNSDVLVWMCIRGIADANAMNDRLKRLEDELNRKLSSGSQPVDIPDAVSAASDASAAAAPADTATASASSPPALVRTGTATTTDLLGRLAVLEHQQRTELAARDAKIQLLSEKLKVRLALRVCLFCNGVF